MSSHDAGMLASCCGPLGPFVPEHVLKSQRSRIDKIVRAQQAVRSQALDE